jgi:AraC family transcriptional regulator of adaptative response / DNA-3-methyladenine glycosylase II
MRYLAGHSIPGIESGDDSHFRRRLRLPGGRAATLDVELDGSDAVVASLDGSGLPEEYRGPVASLFDLAADSAAIDAHLSTDTKLAELIQANPGIRLPGCLDPAEQILRTMIGQQISISAARSVLSRIVAELDGTGLFPSIQQWAERGREVLRGPAGRIAAIVGVAQSLATGTLVVDDKPSAEELTARLLVQPGIGAWTAGYVAMRSLGATDILLSTDLVLRKGAVRLGLPDTPSRIEEYGRRWAPFRSYANLHVWRIAQLAR